MKIFGLSVEACVLFLVPSTFSFSYDLYVLCTLQLRTTFKAHGLAASLTLIAKQEPSASYNFKPIITPNSPSHLPPDIPTLSPYDKARDKPHPYHSRLSACPPHTSGVCSHPHYSPGSDPPTRRPRRRFSGCRRHARSRPLARSRSSGERAGRCGGRRSGGGGWGW